MIRTFHARNYGCLADVTAGLTPLHAFIGPDDSGKTTLLHGLRTIIQLASGAFAFDGGWKPFDPHLPVRSQITNDKHQPHDVALECDVDRGWYAYAIGSQGPEERISREQAGDDTGKGTYQAAPRLATDPSAFRARNEISSRHVLSQLAAARLVRFDCDALRRPSGLIPETQPVGFLDEQGHGLAGVYFALRNRDDNAFSTIVEGVRRHFPTLRSLRVKAVTDREVVLEAELVDGARVEAKRMSEGLLYSLAFAALRHLDPVSLLLVEHPEHGLHPVRIAAMVRSLRAIVQEVGTQVVLATHSPLVINELAPDEVSVVTRTPEEGTKVTRIKDTPDFEQRAKVYALGELWLSYSNGEDEAPLWESTER